MSYSSCPERYLQFAFRGIVAMITQQPVHRSDMDEADQAQRSAIYSPSI
jgi:hypothetical protein